MKNKIPILLIILFRFFVTNAEAQTTEFTYQGRLNDSGLAATGNYDLQFSLFDDPVAGTQLGTTKTATAVSVSNGIFTVHLDFGAAFTGPARYLQIAVRASSASAFTSLSPRQPITSAPYSVRSLNALTSDVAVNSTQLGGIDASQYIQTTDTRLSDARTPLPGSADYIQNTTNSQPSASFNISGVGRANSFNSNTAYQIGGTQVLSVPGNANVFLGNAAGSVNSTGSNNTFGGTGTGQANTTGFRNSFFGAFAGATNLVGNNNAMFGASAGTFSIGDRNSFFGDSSGANTTSGSSNTFIGTNTGLGNTSGSNNTLLGFGANVGANNLTFATAIGSGSTVSASNTVVLGRVADTVQVPGNLNVAGTFGANIFDAVVQYNIGGSRILSVFGTSNLFAGQNAGTSITTGQQNAFFGSAAGLSTTTGSFNAFFGTSAGAANIDGQNNAFFGSGTGNVNTSGNSNTFLGAVVGVSNTTGSNNVFIGGNSGLFNQTGSNNTFVGTFSGRAVTADANSFFGAQSGQATTSGTQNAFGGFRSGAANTTGSFNTFFGSNSGAANTTAINNAFFGQGSGFKNTVGHDNTFLGNGAGLNNTIANGNTFVGSLAGQLTVGGGNNTFLGVNAGSSNVGSSNNTFIGANVADSNLTGSGNTYIGAGADGSGTLTNAAALGQNAFVAQSNSLILGSINGVNGATADTSVGIGTTQPDELLHIKNPSRAFVKIESTNAGTNSGLELKNSSSDWMVFTDNDASGFTLHFNNFSQSSGEALTLGYSSNIPTAAVNRLWIKSLPTGGSQNLCINGVVVSLCSSSLRFKKDIGAFNGGLDIVRRLSPITFRWKSDNMLDLGFGAEDVAKVEPLLVTKDSDGVVSGVKYDRISAVLVNAVKEQQDQIASQQREVSQQSALLEKQQQQIDELRRIVASQVSRRRPTRLVRGGRR